MIQVASQYGRGTCCCIGRFWTPASASC